MTNTLFLTTDFHLAGYLTARDYPTEISENADKKIEYVFTDSKMLQRDIENYKNDVGLHQFRDGLRKVNKLFHAFKRSKKDAI